MHGSWYLLTRYGISLLHTTAVVCPRSNPELCHGMAGFYVFYDLNSVLEFYGIISSLLCIRYKHDLVVTERLWGCGCKQGRDCRCFRNWRKANLLKASMFFSLYMRMPIWIYYFCLQFYPKEDQMWVLKLQLYFCFEVVFCCFSIWTCYDVIHAHVCRHSRHIHMIFDCFIFLNFMVVLEPLRT